MLLGHFFRFSCAASRFFVSCAFIALVSGLAVASQPPILIGQESFVWGQKVPAAHVNPYQRILNQGAVLADIEVHIEKARRPVYPFEWFYQLRNVASVEVPSWAREIMVVFEPDPEMNSSTFPGLYLRPDHPFVEGAWPFDGAGGAGTEPGWMGAMERHAHPQAAFRSESHGVNLGQPLHPLFVFVDGHMDPEPAGRAWHIAMGHRSTGTHSNWDNIRFDDIKGRVRVYARGASEPVPLAFQFFFPAEEQTGQTGFFDNTPRSPTGNNPGTTLGEARRWVLYQAADDLLEKLDFRAHLPLAVGARFSDATWFGPIRSTTGNSPRISGSRHTPGRFGHEGIVQSVRRIERGGIHTVALNRESGTLPSLISTGARLSMANPWPGQDILLGPDNQFPPKTLDRPATLLVFDDTAPHANWAWILDRPDPTISGGLSLWFSVQQQLSRLLVQGGMPTLSQQTYVAAFDPPRHIQDNPDPFGDPEGWLDEADRIHFYGPHVVHSASNPWRDTDEPGIRMATLHETLTGLSGPCDDTGCWWDLPDSGGVLAWAQQDSNPPVGIARDIMADLGLAENFRAFRERDLPRHWYDPTRSGHGIDMRRVEYPDGGMTHFAHLYTYDQNGNPEWWLAIGDVDADRVFSAALEYYTFDEDRSPRQQSDPARQGWLTMILDPPLDHPTCLEARKVGEPFSSQGVIFAVVEWELDGQSGSWCMEPMRFGDQPGMPEDITGSWMAAEDADAGWGFSVVHRNYGPRPILNTILYYYDATGNPTWASGVVGGGRDLPYGALAEGVELEMLHINGFCRSCEPTPLDLHVAGHLNIKLAGPDFGTNTGNWIESMDVQHLGPAGGRWQRSDVGVRLLSSPNPSMDP